MGTHTPPARLLPPIIQIYIKNTFQEFGNDISHRSSWNHSIYQQAGQGPQPSLDEDLGKVGRSSPTYEPEKNSLIDRIKSLKPTASHLFSAVLCRDGRVSSNPKDLVTETKAHWGKLWSDKNVDENALDKVLDSCTRRIPAGLDWSIATETIGDIIRTPKNSSPGPDSIPYICCRAAHELSIRVFQEGHRSHTAWK